MSRFNRLEQGYFLAAVRLVFQCLDTREDRVLLVDDLIIRLAQELALHEPRISLKLRYGGQRGLRRLHLLHLLLLLEEGFIVEQLLALFSLTR